MADNKDKKVLNVPALRFPEFSGEWNTSSIGEQFELYSGNTPSRMDKKQFDGTINWITSGELKEHYIADTKEKISDEAVKSNNLKLLSVGTFVIAIYGLEADGVRGTCSITASESTISQACMAFISKKDIANEFLYAWYKKHGNIIGIRYAQGTKQQNLSYDIIEKFNISYPCIEEQKKLIHFISLIDERIVTQNKIIEKLETLIKGIVDFIFNANKFPKVPFKEIYIRAGEGGTPATSIPEYYNNGTIPFIKIDDLQNKYIRSNKDCITELGLQKSSAWIVPSNSIIYSNGATIGAISINLFPVCTKQGILGVVPKANINVEFLYYFMTSTVFTKAVERIVTEGTMRTAYLKDINHILCPVPCSTQQDEIAKLLSTLSAKLENEITFHRKLQIQKEFLLSQMFI